MIWPIRATPGVLVLCALAAARPAAAQNVNVSTARNRPPNSVAPPPIPPATVSRTADGGVTVRAVRLAEPIRLDGHLDEPIYNEVPAISDFIQQDPREGEPASEKTEVWIFFDDRNIYLAGRCWDSQPHREIANEMRRDGQNLPQNGNFTFVFDSFHDKRNGTMFQVNPLGAIRDVAITDELNQNPDWNAVWDARAQRSEIGWTFELAIPFKSLRYGPGTEQTWGVNLRRIVRWKNELSYLSAPPSYLTQRAIANVSMAATLVGLEVPKSRPTFEIKPYAISDLRSDVRTGASNRASRDFGVDAKYGLTKGLTLDLTYNTDFAQVEDDAQQVNLTRFNLQFPERREFFLEGQGIFAFGGAQPLPGGGTNPINANIPMMFFSRRIGLNNAGPVPIAGGGRITGRAGPYSIGLLDIQLPGDDATAARATNFSVVRLKRDVLSRSNVGVIYTRRMETARGVAPMGETFGVDALYSHSTALNVTGYYARTRTKALTGDDDSYLGSFDFTGDRYGLQVQALKVGQNFNPQVGFLRRSAFNRGFVQARFSPRPARTHWRAIRRFVYQGNVEYIEDPGGRLDFREQEGQFQIEMNNADTVNVNYTRDYEYIPSKFDIATGVTVPVGGYTYQNLLMSYGFGSQHVLSGTVSFQQGQLYNGTKRTVGLGNGRLKLFTRLSIEPSVSLNWVDLPYGRFTTTVAANRSTLSFNPRLFVSAFVQYASASHTLSSNVRFRWEYRPASELFVVYSDGRDTTRPGFPGLMNRALIVKLTKLFRF